MKRLSGQNVNLFSAYRGRAACVQRLRHVLSAAAAHAFIVCRTPHGKFRLRASMAPSVRKVQYSLASCWLKICSI